MYCGLSRRMQGRRKQKQKITSHPKPNGGNQTWIHITIFQARPIHIQVIFATQCWWAPARVKQLSTVAILLYRFLSCWCLQTFFTWYQPCSLLPLYHSHSAFLLPPGGRGLTYQKDWVACRTSLGVKKAFLASLRCPGLKGQKQELFQHLLGYWARKIWSEAKLQLQLYFKNNWQYTTQKDWSAK